MIANQKLIILIITFAVNNDSEITEIYFPIKFKSPPFVTVVDNDGNVGFHKSIGYGWAHVDYFTCRYILGSATALVVGYIN